MNEITFILSKQNLNAFKEVIKFDVIPQNLLIKTDEDKNIIFVFIDYYQYLKQPHDHIVFTTDYKSEIDFMVFKKKIPIITKYYFKLDKWKETKTKQLSPIFIPPIDEYEVTILLKEKHYNLHEFDSESKQLQSDLLHDTNAGIVAKDQNHLREILLELYQEFNAKGNISCASHGIEKYSRKMQVERLAEIVKSL